MSTTAPDLYSRMRAYIAAHPQVTIGTPATECPQVTFGTPTTDQPTAEASQMSLARTRVQRRDRPPLSPLSLSISPIARVSDKWDARLRPARAPDRPRWCDLASALFWLARRGWPSLEVGGETIAGEPAWRVWVRRASLAALLAVRDRVAPRVQAPSDRQPAPETNAEAGCEGDRATPSHRIANPTVSLAAQALPDSPCAGLSK
jgi:hypothetical protein